ncbi:hypothetical protein [Pseudaestuariivita sp.]|uniref:hypothetical protein n=1 Tax=Pseudaestuariivita sp. TaxID=2211669 RepID=UPI004059D862
MLALAACDPAIPDSAAGADARIAAQREARDAQLAGAGSFATPTTDAEAAAAARAANSGVAPIEANPANPVPGSVPAPGGNAGISNEQDFDVVSNQRSIEADAARVEANAAQYQVIAPTELPSRTGASGPNVVEYALSTSHPKGQSIYRRVGFRLEARSQRNCAGFASGDEAQIAFLAAGGPQRDRQSLDPDGDGYACSWDPAPYRAIRAAAAPDPAVPALGVTPPADVETSVIEPAQN